MKEELPAENGRNRLEHSPDEVVLSHQRSAVERVDVRLKDEFVGRMLHIRGHARVMCHLMFGILALTANQLMTFVT